MKSKGFNPTEIIFSTTTAAFHAAFNQFYCICNFQIMGLAVNKTMLAVQVAGGGCRKNNFGGVEAF